LKESGDIEYTADLCLGLTQPTPFHFDETKGIETRLHVIKNRYGDFRGEIKYASYRLIYPSWLFEEVAAANPESIYDGQLHKLTTQGGATHGKKKRTKASR